LLEAPGEYEGVVFIGCVPEEDLVPVRGWPPE